MLSEIATFYSSIVVDFELYGIVLYDIYTVVYRTGTRYGAIINFFCLNFFIMSQKSERGFF